jgi:hypothetical protein
MNGAANYCEAMIAVKHDVRLIHRFDLALVHDQPVEAS